MKTNILIGGAAGQGINKVSQIFSEVLSQHGYYTFNYRDYMSLIRGGHNFNTLSFSKDPIESHDARVDVLVALDERTIKTHKAALKKEGKLILGDDFKDLGRNQNVALAGVLTKMFGIPLETLEEKIKDQFKKSEEAIKAAKQGYDSVETKQELPKLKTPQIKILSGSQSLAIGALKAGLELYVAYPMTPATNALHELASYQQSALTAKQSSSESGLTGEAALAAERSNLMVFQAENEIAAASMALGASFAGKKVMTGTSGGGFDLMGESLSMQGMSEIPLTVYLASRVGPASGIPTYTAQSDLEIALRSGHGEFPRIVVAPGNPTEQIEKTQEAMLLAERFKTLSIILSDKHLAESEFSSSLKPSKVPTFKINRALPGHSLVKNSSYESDNFGNSTESYTLAENNSNLRIKKYDDMKKYITKNFEMIKIHGNKKSKNLIIGWGSTSGAIKDAIKNLDAKFLQVLYCKPLSPKIKKEMGKADKIILVECNVTGQLGRLIREKTGISIPNRLLKYNGRPFHTDELNKLIKSII